MLGVSHRRRAQVTPRGMVGNPAASRHKDVRELLGICPVPAFVTDAEARLLAASDLFGQLVASSPDEILGQTPGQTRLGNVYADLDDDITRVAQRRAPVRRRLDFREESGASASMLVWLVPAPTGVQGGGVWGFVLALDDPAGLDE
jgi:hypothetical protein